MRRPNGRLRSSARPTTPRSLAAIAVVLAVVAGACGRGSEPVAQRDAGGQAVSMGSPEWVGELDAKGLRIALVGEDELLGADPVASKLVERGNRVSIHARDGSSALALPSLSYPDEAPDLLLLSVGAEDLAKGSTAGRVLSLLRATGPRVGAGCTVLTTVPDEVPGASDLNQAIRDATTADARFELADWAAEVSTRQGLVGADGRTLTTEGEEAFGQLVLDRLMSVRPGIGGCVPVDPDADTWGTVDQRFVGTGRRVLITGDSLTVTTRRQLRAGLDDHAVKIVAWAGEGFAGGRISEFVGTPTLVLGTAEAMADDEQPDVWVVALGSNDAWTEVEGAYEPHPGPAHVERQMDELLAAGPDDLCVVGVTVTESGPPGYDATKAARINDLIRARADVVVDWATLGAGPVYTASDRLHLTPAGAEYRTGLVTDAVRACPS